MKKYFVIRGEYRNTYKLYSAKTEATAAKLIASGAERITLKEAKNLIQEEKERRKYNKAFSGYASVAIEDADEIKKYSVTTQCVDLDDFDNLNDAIDYINKNIEEDMEEPGERILYAVRDNEKDEIVYTA